MKSKTELVDNFNLNYLALDIEENFEKIDLYSPIFNFVYLDNCRRNEMVEITNMIKLAGYKIKRLVLFPILDQKEASRKKCSVCLREDENHLSLCRWCLGVTYCSQECWNQDSLKHKVICGPSKVDKIRRSKRAVFQDLDEEKEGELKM